MHAPAPRTRIPCEIKVELASRQDNVLSGISRVVTEFHDRVQQDGDPTEWLQKLQTYLATGEPMIVHARMGRTLVGFLLLDADKGAAPFSWVDQRYRNRGLGERFYSFACINLARPAPEFKFPKDMLGEYDGVLKAAGAHATLHDSFYVVHEANPPGANGNDGTRDPGGRVSKSPPRRLVIEDGDWVGFSHHDARRLKIRYGRFSRRD
jgi:hypothetical protein